MAMRFLFICFSLQQNCVPQNGRQNIKIKQIQKVSRFTLALVSLSPGSCWPCAECLDNSRSLYAKGLVFLCNFINYQNITVL